MGGFCEFKNEISSTSNCCVQKGVSALSMAAEIADPALVDMLLAAGADVTLVDEV